MNAFAVVGGWGNTRQVIRKTTDDDIFERVQLRNLVASDKQTRILLQMTLGTESLDSKFDAILSFHEVTLKFFFWQMV